MRERPEDVARQAVDREGLAVSLDVLGNDAIERGSEWENLHIFDMLESMAAWLVLDVCAGRLAGLRVWLADRAVRP
jgi:hypothetical protein